MRQVAGGREFFYDSVGEGRPLVVFHGWRGDHRSMKDAIEPVFADRSGWRRIYPDLPGMGRTSGAGISTQDQVLDALIEFVDAVADGDRIAVGGFSYGGYLALGFACRHAQQLDGLMVVAPGGLPGGGVEPTLPAHEVLVSDPRIFDGVDDEVAEAFRSLAVVQSAELLDGMVELALPAHELADDDYLAALDEHWPFSSDVECLQTPFPGPTLLVTGRQDAVVGHRDAYRLLENYPRGTFVALDRAGHFLPWEQRTLFGSLVGEWIDRVEEFGGDDVEPGNESTR
jgi:pimeloyl-ACP methyl ester carboxylesterase